MFFKFTPLGGSEIDLTDFVDKITSVEPVRLPAVAEGGILTPSRLLGGSMVTGFRLTTEGLLFATDLNDLRTKLGQILEQSVGWLQIESDRKALAELEENNCRDWVGGVPALFLTMRFLVAGYSQDINLTTVNASGGAWSANNTGELPCPMRIQMQFQNTQSNQKVLITGYAPDGQTSLSFTWQGNITAGDVLVIDSGVQALEVKLNGNDASTGIREGYPPWLKVGLNSINYSLVPSNTLSSNSLSFYRRWRFV